MSVVDHNTEISWQENFDIESFSIDQITSNILNCSQDEDGEDDVDDDDVVVDDDDDVGDDDDDDDDDDDNVNDVIPWE